MPIRIRPAILRIASISLLAIALVGCATVPPSQRNPRDPWQRFNRGTFKFNDALDRAIVKPVARTYVRVTPQLIRTGVTNFFNNLTYPDVIVNALLQGQLKPFARDTGRLVVNTTIGIGGLFDPATPMGLTLEARDFGQTFGKWGMKPGPYIVWPILGPSTARDSLGKLVDQFTYPVTYLEDDSTRYIIRGVSLLDMRAGLLDLDAQIDRAYDRYSFVRNAWLQRREFQVTDGEIEDPSLELEEGMEEPPAENAPETDTAAPDAPAPEGSTPDKPAPDTVPQPAPPDPAAQPPPR